MRTNEQVRAAYIEWDLAHPYESGDPLSIPDFLREPIRNPSGAEYVPLGDSFTGDWGGDRLNRAEEMRRAEKKQKTAERIRKLKASKIDRSKLEWDCQRGGWRDKVTGELVTLD